MILSLSFGKEDVDDKRLIYTGLSSCSTLVNVAVRYVVLKGGNTRMRSSCETCSYHFGFGNRH